ncbi:hypothetical protein HPB48_005108 [Haemaphysalis longicornis]|uniref:Uncharacterized protein n=1 Tax=Haemaphysalis longicornis TaxID=44386 RepID=A0A9J6FFG8_HAELO|nr:hypothetical protein HPB48_005108 [Haemaphysalis longicornis]
MGVKYDVYDSFERLYTGSARKRLFCKFLQERFNMQAVHTMAENQPPADDWAYVPSALKEAVTVEKVREGTVLELQPSAGNDEAEQSRGFEAANMMENLRLDFLHGGEEADDDDDNMEFKLPFERMALKMEPVTKDRLVLKKVMKPGAGLVVKAGSGVSFHYNAYLEMSDEPFDSTRLRGYPHRCLYVHAAG